MQATQVLRDEHEGILAMLAIVEAAAQRLQSGKDIPRDLMPNAVNFFRNFADKCHHGKEEDELFPAMEQRGVPKEGGPIGAMLAEHDQGRAFVRAMSDAANRYAQGDQSAVTALVQNTLGYVNLLRQHIWKENNVLFQMADQVLADADQEKLSAAFDNIEATRTGPGEHERYHALIAEYQKIAASWS
ncbi:MAG: hemerythrin domain-containing protein [Anaerolineales bacterium]|nr:hemerythrin domain-containing protein [Anaerolineales bacterium]